MHLQLKRLLVISLLFLVIISAVNSQSQAASPKVKLTYWWWAEGDAPGADKWMLETAKLYNKLHPNVTIEVVPQSTDTFIASFQTAAQAKSGPDIACQWATIPVLSQAWAGAIVPISDYIPKTELKHWLNLDENLYGGKIWGGSLYMIGVPLVYNKALFKKAGLNPEKPPITWDEFLDYCAKLKKAGIIPIGGGTKGDSNLGPWMFSVLNMQYLDSPNDILKLLTGEADFSNPKYGDWYNKFYELCNKGYYNDDIASLDWGQGVDLFSRGKVAFEWATDGNILQYAKDIGPENIGLTRTPTIANAKGKLKNCYNTTQSTSQMITSWCKDKKVAANFLMFMHSPERMNAWYLQTMTIPADDRFNQKLITDPIMKHIYALNTSSKNVWMENYIPTQLDTNGYRPAGQIITSGSGKPADVYEILERTLKLWRMGKPDELARFKGWLGRD
ncbi:MAG TPA: hypothetical protein DDW65_13905 [Firmicutes bacterium]|jgi:raffinose/stachyose/melibiose transport system substrate-binding protein|nr:hypothetical protein [Bacillota bacterium]